MHKVSIRGAALVGLAITSSLRAAEIPIIVQDVLGHNWPTSLVHRTVDFGKVKFTPGKVALFDGSTAMPVQLDAIVTNANGTLKRADVWFQTGLASNETRTFVLREGASAVPPPGAAPSIVTSGATLTLDNGLTAVKCPAASWSVQADSATADIATALNRHLDLPSQSVAIPAPLLGIRLPSGRWTASSRLGPARPVRFEPLQ